MQGKLWVIFLLPEIPIFSNLAGVNRKEWNQGKSRNIYMPIKDVEYKDRLAVIFKLGSYRFGIGRRRRRGLVQIFIKSLSFCFV
jgi:hypothetical protein